MRRIVADLKKDYNLDFLVNTFQELDQTTHAKEWQVLVCKDIQEISTIIADLDRDAIRNRKPRILGTIATPGARDTQ